MKKKNESRYFLDRDFFKVEPNLSTLNQLKSSFESGEPCLAYEEDEGPIYVYNKFLFIILTTEFNVTNLDTKSIESIQGYTFFEDYKKGFIEGMIYFDEKYKVSNDVKFQGGTNNYFVKFLHNLYYHEEVTGFDKGWKSCLNFTVGSLNSKYINRIGYYSAMIHKIYLLKKEYPLLFQNFEKHEHTPPLLKRNLTEYKHKLDRILNYYEDFIPVINSVLLKNLLLLKESIESLNDKRMIVATEMQFIVEQLYFDLQPEEIATFHNYAIKKIQVIFSTLILLKENSSEIFNNSKANKEVHHVWHSLSETETILYSDDSTGFIQLLFSQLQTSISSFKEVVQDSFFTYKKITDNGFVKNNNHASPMDDLEKLSYLENKFMKAIPMTEVINHFRIFTEVRSKNNAVFLTKSQLISFIKRGFLNDDTEPIQKFNLTTSEKGRIILRFHEFYTLSCVKYGVINKTKPFKELIIKCFDNWTSESITPFFKPNITKEKWE